MRRIYGPGKITLHYFLIFGDYFISCAVDIVNRPLAGQLRNWRPISKIGKKFVSRLKLPACLQSQTKSSQRAKGGDLQEAQVLVLRSV